MHPPIRGFIFDLDGVLTDTSEYHYLAWQKLCDELEIPFDRQRCEGFRGLHRADALRSLLTDRTVTESEFAEMLDRKNRYYLEFSASLSPANLLPGAGRLLNEVRRVGLKVAVASASRNAGDVIRRLQIDSMVDALSDGNSVARGKPAPDLFLHAAEQLLLPPAECVVVEDAEAGVEAALAAGIRVIGLGPEWRVGRAHMVLPDLSQAHLVDIIDRLSCDVGCHE